MTTISARLRILREQAGMSRNGLAARAAMSKDTIGGLETGRKPGVTLHTLTHLAGVLRVPVAVLLGDQPIPDPTWAPGGPGWTAVRAEVEQMRGAA